MHGQQQLRGGCLGFTRLLDPYADAELTLEARLSVSRHLLDCPACDRLLNAILRLKSQVSAAVRRMDAPPWLHARIVSRAA